MTDRHGHYLGYRNDGCRCDDCTTAAARERARSQLRAARGEVWADVNAVRAHLHKFLKEGVTRNGISNAANVGKNVVWRLLEGGRIRREPGEKLMAMTWDDLPERAYVSSDRIVELIERRRDAGWSDRQIALAAGWRGLPTDWPGEHVYLSTLRRFVAALDLCASCDERAWAGGLYCSSCSPAAGRAA